MPDQVSRRCLVYRALLVASNTAHLVLTVTTQSRGENGGPNWDGFKNQRLLGNLCRFISRDDVVSSRRTLVKGGLPSEHEQGEC